MIVLLALLIGTVAGLRAMTAPAAIAWSAHLGILDLRHSWLAWLGSGVAAWLLGAAAVAEIVNDKLPSTPSRKIPVQFGTRLLTGGLAGAAIALPSGAWIPGVIAGVIGAVIGTYAGAAARAANARMFDSDRPGAFLEDIVAIGAAIAIVSLS